MWLGKAASRKRLGERSGRPCVVSPLKGVRCGWFRSGEHGESKVDLGDGVCEVDWRWEARYTTLDGGLEAVQRSEDHGERLMWSAEKKGAISQIVHRKR